MPEGNADRRERLYAALDQTSTAIQAVDDESRASEGFSLVERTLAYARLVVEQSDAELISDSALTALENAATTLAANAPTAVANARTYADSILNTLPAFPVAQGRDMEQAAREAAATFQRSATQRLAAVQGELVAFESEIASARTKIEEDLSTLREEIEAAATIADTNVTTLASGFQAKLDEFDEALATQRTALTSALERQSETFTETQEARAAEFQQALKDAQAELAELQKESQEKVDQHVAEIERMEKDSAALVGAIGLAGTAERYGEEAKEQKKVADRMRTITFVLASGAIVMAIFAAIHHADETTTLLSKLGVSAVFGALAAYTAKQSGRHRVREERARNLQLELTAFAPFIEPLDPAQRELERVIMARKTFGQIRALPEADDDHSFGPLGPVEDLLKRAKTKPASDGA
jgi:hypothetical protein